MGSTKPFLTILSATACEGLTGKQTFFALGRILEAQDARGAFVSVPGKFGGVRRYEWCIEYPDAQIFLNVCARPTA